MTNRDTSSIRIDSSVGIPSEFTSLGAGFYRNAHSIWELRASEDDPGGYYLVRKREERAVDLRDDLPKTASQNTETRVDRHLCVGMKVSLVRQGQILPVIVLTVEDGSATVKSEDSEMETQSNIDTVHLITPEDLLIMDDENCGAECHCPCHSHSEGFEPAVQPASKMGSPSKRPNMDLTMDYRTWGFKATASFSPLLMGEDCNSVSQGTVWESRGFSPPNEIADRMSGIRNPCNFEPRMRLVDPSTSEVMYVTPMELNANFTATTNPTPDSEQITVHADLDPVVEMPGESSGSEHNPFEDGTVMVPYSSMKTAYVETKISVTPWLKKIA